MGFWGTGAASDRVNKSKASFTFGKIHVTANCAVNGLILATLGLVREHYAFPVREGALSQVAPHSEKSRQKIPCTFPGGICSSQ